jgi:hypothetical protein
MYKSAIICLAILIGLSANAQTINLRGVVSNAGGQPIDKAVVTLVLQKMKDTTGTDGKYSFTGSGIVQLPEIVPQNENISMNNGVVQFTLNNSSPVTVELYDVKGTLLKKEQLRNAAAGIYRFNIAQNCMATNLLIIKASIGEREVSFPFMTLSSGTYAPNPSDALASSSIGNGLTKTVAVLDTLTVTASGFKTKSLAITSYENQQQNISLDSSNDYQGPCDVLPNGCAEAYSMARAMTAKYTGPLFQLGLANDNTKKLDIGQTSDRKADMTTWSAFCGGAQSNLRVSKIYAQIHKGSNDLVPAVFKAPYGPNCSAGGYTCAAKFTIETATGLPILTTDAPQEYCLAGDAFATGVNGGTHAVGLMYNGKPVPNQVYCCGVFGITHKYNASDTWGTDFMVALAYGWKDGGGCCIAVNCGASNKYCVGAEEEENNDLYDYGTSPIENAMVVTQFDPNPTSTHGTVISYLNGKQVLSKSPPAPLSRGNYPINAGTAIHVGGGGDLSQPDPVRMREALITNNVMSASEVTAMKTNITGFFSTLKFP